MKFPIFHFFLFSDFPSSPIFGLGKKQSYDDDNNLDEYIDYDDDDDDDDNDNNDNDFFIGGVKGV